MDPIERARKGDVEFFRKNGESVFINSRDGCGDSVLSEAARLGHVECLKVILEKCPQLLHMQNSSDGYSALHWAADNSKPEIAKLLIGGAGPWLFRMVDNEGKAALQLAVERQKLEIANMLTEADPNHVFSADENGENPLSIAVKQSFGKTDDHDISVKMRRLLLEKLPTQIKARIGNLEWTVLHNAAANGELGAFEDIIRFCPQCIQLVDNNGHNFLHIAAKIGQGGIVGHALQMKEVTYEFLNKQDKEGNTVLHCATFESRQEIVRLLISGAEPRLFRTVNNQGKTALQIAVEKMNLVITNMLTKADPSYIFPADKNGQNPLSIALQLSFGKTNDNDSVKIRRLLLEKLPGQVKVRIGNLGWTILHSAASEGDLGAFEDIIRFYPKFMQLIDNNGQNFMHIAAKSGREEIVRHALETKEMIAGILNKQDNEGNSPLHVALQSGNNSLALNLVYDLRVVKMIKNAQRKTALSMINFDFDKKRAFGLDEEVLKWSIPTEHLELYGRLDKRFGELTQRDLPEFKVGPARQALCYFLEIITEMLDTTSASITEEKLSKWESVSSFYSFVGLRIGWFPQRVSWFRECFSRREKEIISLARDFEISDKTVQLKRKELANVEAELGRIRVALETARTSDSKLDFTIFDC